MIICLAATSVISAPVSNSLERRGLRHLPVATIRAWRINGLNREDKEPIIAKEKETEKGSSERPEGLEIPKTITFVQPPPAKESDRVESPAEDPAEATLSPEVFDQVGFLLKTLLAPLEN